MRGLIQIKAGAEGRAEKAVIERTPPMELSTLLILGYIVAFFSAFIVVIGGVWAGQVIGELRDKAAARRTVRTGGLQAV